MNRYEVYTIFTFVNKTEVIANNEKSAKNKIKELAETTNIFSQKIPVEEQNYKIEKIKLIETKVHNKNKLKEYNDSIFVKDAK